MSGIIGKKIGMTTMYNEGGRNLPCTVIEAGPCIVTQVKTDEVDGYSAVQIAFGERKEKNTPNALKGHFKKAKTTPKTDVLELKSFDTEMNLGDSVTVEMFEEGEFVDVVGTSKGKGFQGVVKRHGFGGVGQATHGQHNRLRAPGSIGNASTPARVFKGMKIAGRMGGDRVKVQNLKVIKVIADKNLLIVNGAIPGANGSSVIVEK